MPATPQLFGRDALAVLEVAKQAAAAIVVLVHIQGFTPDRQAAVLAVVYALVTAGQACLVRPIAPTVFTGVIQAAGAAILHFGYEVSAEQVAAVVLVTSGVMGLLVRQSSTPRADPRPLAELGTT